MQLPQDILVELMKEIGVVVEDALHLHITGQTLHTIGKIYGVHQARKICHVGMVQDQHHHLSMVNEVIILIKSREDTGESGNLPKLYLCLLLLSYAIRALFVPAIILY
jgi:hypothetical protein